ncbi:MAG: NAD(P)H-dependent glycerol-3-phosphate dehydrogenase [Isosphaeraceae bacterium]
MKRVAVLGAGGMGTALALLFAKGGAQVRLWARDPDRAARMATTRENTLHLPGIHLPKEIEVTERAEHAVDSAELALVAIPTSYLRATLGLMAAGFPAELPVLSVVKGIENQSFSRPSQIITEVLGPRSVSVLSGPSHAEELAKGLPASVVIGGRDEALNVRVQDVLNQGMFRVCTNPDALGVELAGALKNIRGIAAGVCDGLGLGDNAKSALLTRGLAEITRFGVSLGAAPETFFGLAGVGDVITTCFSPFGRNRQVGDRIGRGERLVDVLASMVNVAEGVPTTRSVHGLAASRGVEVPITTELHAILFEDKPPRDALLSLMDRMPKPEWIS